ncbi:MULTISPECIES: hypothetical protein [Streptomyces]|uniref:Uncharacterized protein n=2 Tax=Streptomyces TaxID=1883 RepID=A0A2U9NZ18_STRAS|nr:hypothetical protein [Streptomyces actuosus]AWT42589.1 hypothetical protein DMT42_09865 [Streptomyces actuosus]MBM4819800.1 hypothetical protein [Streptomyces actuosus]
MHSFHLKQVRQQMVEDFLAEQKRLREEFDARLEAIDEKIKKAEAEENQQLLDPFVLVRSSLGARRRVYHSADHPCGRTKYDGGRQSGFKKMRESEAKQMDGGILTRCPTCWKPWI